MGMITHRKRPMLVEPEIPDGLGSLNGLWRTRDGRFVKINRFNDTIGSYTGSLYDEDGERTNERVTYYSANHQIDHGLDLMIRQRGDEKNCEDFLWPNLGGGL